MEMERNEHNTIYDCLLQAHEAYVTGNYLRAADLITVLLLLPDRDKVFTPEDIVFLECDLAISLCLGEKYDSSICFLKDLLETSTSIEQFSDDLYDRIFIAYSLCLLNLGDCMGAIAFLSKVVGKYDSIVELMGQMRKMVKK